MKQPKTVQQACDELIQKVRFERAGFRLPGSHISNDKDTEIIREATRLYMETWVVPLLEGIRDGDVAELARRL